MARYLCEITTHYVPPISPPELTSDVGNCKDEWIVAALVFATEENSHYVTPYLAMVNIFFPIDLPFNMADQHRTQI